jgi:hypothetical protein
VPPLERWPCQSHSTSAGRASPGHCESASGPAVAGELRQHRPSRVAQWRSTVGPRDGGTAAGAPVAGCAAAVRRRTAAAVSFTATPRRGDGAVAGPSDDRGGSGRAERAGLCGLA